MNATESKRLAILRVLQILEQYSDETHPLTQQEIIELLNKNYGITVDRKTIGRNLALLRDSGYDIIRTRSGSYLKARGFDDFELRVLTDGVLNSAHISERRSKDLVKKLCTLSNSYFNPHIGHILLELEKKNDRALFYNLGLIDSAIEQSRQIEYDLNKFGVGGRLHKILRQRVSPYQIILSGGKYYLYGAEEYWGEFVRHAIDHITNITIIERPASPLKNMSSVKSEIEGLSISEDTFSQKKQQCVFLADTEIIDELVSRFGGAVKMVSDEAEKKVRVKIKATIDEAERLALEHISGLEIISPKPLRKKIKNALKEGVKKYK